MTRTGTLASRARIGSSTCGRVLVALATVGLALPAVAQVYKCVDKAGRITYQQQRCPDAQKGSRLDVPLNNGSVQDDDTDGQWAAKASRKEVGVGMPRAYVVKAYGTPQEMRAGRGRRKMPPRSGAIGAATWTLSLASTRARWRG